MGTYYKLHKKLYRQNNPTPKRKQVTLYFTVHVLAVSLTKKVYIR